MTLETSIATHLHFAEASIIFSDTRASPSRSPSSKMDGDGISNVATLPSKRKRASSGNQRDEGSNDAKKADIESQNGRELMKSKRDTEGTGTSGLGSSVTCEHSEMGRGEETEVAVIDQTGCNLARTSNGMYNKTGLLLLVSLLNISQGSRTVGKLGERGKGRLGYLATSQISHC